MRGKDLKGAKLGGKTAMLPSLVIEYFADCLIGEDYWGFELRHLCKTRDYQDGLFIKMLEYSFC